MFPVLSVKKYLVPNKPSLISTGENTLPTLSARLAHMAHFLPCFIWQKNASVVEVCFLLSQVIYKFS